MAEGRTTSGHNEIARVILFEDGTVEESPLRFAILPTLRQVGIIDAAAHRCSAVCQCERLLGTNPKCEVARECTSASIRQDRRKGFCGSRFRSGQPTRRSPEKSDGHTSCPGTNCGYRQLASSLPVLGVDCGLVHRALAFWSRVVWSVPGVGCPGSKHGAAHPVSVMGPTTDATALPSCP